MKTDFEFIATSELDLYQNKFTPLCTISIPWFQIQGTYPAEARTLLDVGD